MAGELAALAPELDDARLKKDAKKALENAGIKLKDDNNAALLFLSTAQARALARLAAEDCEEKDDYKKALKENPSVDMALFGRMVASDPSLNYDAAAQVAHSISTHAVQNEFDYFTAVDDCAPEDSAGAGHLGTVEYNSSTLYRYATVNMVELVHLLGAEKGSPGCPGVRRSLHPLHAHRKAEQLCQPHPAGCCLCHPAGGSACEPLRCL